MKKRTESWTFFQEKPKKKKQQQQRSRGFRCFQKAEQTVDRQKTGLWHRAKAHNQPPSSSRQPADHPPECQRQRRRKLRVAFFRNFWRLIIFIRRSLQHSTAILTDRATGVGPGDGLNPDTSHSVTIIMTQQACRATVTTYVQLVHLIPLLAKLVLNNEN